MDTDKAYLLGLVIGGGIWGNIEDVFKIRLPYKQWGSYEQDPRRAGQISRDIMSLVSPLFKAVYGINISYDTNKSGEWNILCEGDLSDLKADLEKYDIQCEGELRKIAEIDKIIVDLIDDNMKRRFIAGLADTIGSTKRSHRRFTDDKQMISFEISGFGFKFVCSLCRLLHSIKCYPDQILWNHPNFHCASNPYDKKWKKGFKLRVYLDQYDKFGAFAFTSKAESSIENRYLELQENTAIPCEERIIMNPTVSCVHCDENSILLPEIIRGGHYLHNRHVCAVMGCEHAPYSQVTDLIKQAEKYINPFPVLVKGTSDEISNIISNSQIYSNRTYNELYVKISELYSKYKENSNSLLFSLDTVSGYPINQMMKAVTYLTAAELGKLNGLRPKGKMDDILSEYLKLYSNATVKILKPDLLTPVILSIGEHSALVGANNPSIYKRLIHTVPNNDYKIVVSPVSEDDLK